MTFTVRVRTRWSRVDRTGHLVEVRKRIEYLQYCDDPELQYVYGYPSNRGTWWMREFIF